MRPLAACVEMYPPPAIGTPTTITVHAMDKANPPTRVAGTARTGTTTFPTGTPVSLTPCYAPPTGSGCAPIVVRAPGYTDLAISNYWAPSGGS